jgi:hypothetical protein
MWEMGVHLLRGAMPSNTNKSTSLLLYPLDNFHTRSDRGRYRSKFNYSIFERALRYALGTLAKTFPDQVLPEKSVNFFGTSR